MCIRFLCAFLEFISISAFFYAIFQNAHKNRWMETQLVSDCSKIWNTNVSEVYNMLMRTLIFPIWVYVHALFF